MIILNESDFINLKYLICFTSWVGNEDIVDIKDETSLLKRIEELLKIRGGDNLYKEYLEDLINECFYHLKCYNKLHLKQQCPSKYIDDDDDDNWGIYLPNEAILLLRLYQNLLSDDFFCLLEKVLAVTREQYINFQMNFEVLYDVEKNIGKIKQWLIERNYPIAKNVQKLFDRIGDSSSQENFFITQGILESKDILKAQGICLIINNENCLGCSERIGTDVDKKNITKTFSEMNFHVVAHQNVPKDNLLKILESIKSDITEEHRMFVAFFLSHGKKGSLKTSDGKEIKFKDLWYPFRSSQCKILKKKAKLFFFVCCQGKDSNKSISNDDIQIDSSTLEFDAIPDKSADPDVGNFFLGYATYKTFLSFRDASEGTYYIRYLCETIRKHPCKSISEIHEITQGIITEAKIPGKNCFQMPYFENFLRETCYFVDEELKLILSNYELLK